MQKPLLIDRLKTGQIVVHNPRDTQKGFDVLEITVGNQLSFPFEPDFQNLRVHGVACRVEPPVLLSHIRADNLTYGEIGLGKAQERPTDLALVRTDHFTNAHGGDVRLDRKHGHHAPFHDADPELVAVLL